MRTPCDDLLDELSDLESGELDAARATELRAHAAGCPPCAGLVRAQAALEHALRSLPGAPVGPFAVPELPPVRLPAVGAAAARLPPGRLLRWAAAAAAVGLVAVGVGMTVGARDEQPERVIAVRPPVTGEQPVISRIVDVTGSGVASDDGLLALTAGLEAVAMRRPARGR